MCSPPLGDLGSPAYGGCLRAFGTYVSQSPFYNQMCECIRQEPGPQGNPELARLQLNPSFQG